MQKAYEFIKEKRTEKGIALRQFCRETGFDPSNWSKIERGILECPKTKEVIDRISATLCLNKTDDQSLKDLIMIDSIPKELRPEENILEKLPLFFRTVRGDNPSKEELIKLIKTIQDS